MTDDQSALPSALNHSNSSDHRYALELAYIGGKFQGWQSQPSGNTIQDTIERALYTIIRQKVRIVGASRTDTGVHAEHQVALLRLPESINSGKLLKSLRALLPEDIGVSNIREVDETFHPILSAKAKLYRYRIWQGQGMSPYLSPFAWAHGKISHIEAMKLATHTLKGKHDFKSFCATDSSVASFERTIFDIQWIQREDLFEFYILGDGFLKQMVRTIVGTLVEVGQGKRAPGTIIEILQSHDRSRAGMCAPAKGLSLVKIYYEPIERIPQDFLDLSNCLTFRLF